jgi:hypothetical protein
MTDLADSGALPDLQEQRQRQRNPLLIVSVQFRPTGRGLDVYRNTTPEFRPYAINLTMLTNIATTLSRYQISLTAHAMSRKEQYFASIRFFNFGIVCRAFAYPA